MSETLYRAEQPGARHIIARWFAVASLVAITVAWAPLGNTASYISMILAAIAALVGWRTEVFVAGARQHWLWMFLLAFVLMAVAFLFNADPKDLIYIGDFLFLPFGLVFALAFSALVGHAGVRQLAWLFLLGALFAVLVGLSDVYAQGQARAHGFSNSPIHFANIAVIVGFMAMTGTFVGRHRFSLLFYSGPILGIAAATLAGTRGAYFVAAMLSVVFAVFVVARRPEKLGTKLLGLAGLAAILVLAVLLGHALGFTRPLQTFEIVRDMITGQQLGDNSTAYRLAMYQSGLRAFFDAPMFGHGWHNQIAAALPYMDEFGRAGYAAEQWSYIHNELLGFALSGGILGIVAFFAIILAPVVGLKEVARDNQAVARAYLVATMLVGVFIGGLTDVLFMTELTKSFYVAMTAAILILCVAPTTSAAGAVHD